MRQFFAFLLLLAPLISSASPEEDLLRYLASIEGLSGNFEQTQAASGAEQASMFSEGQFAVLKGGYFSWSIESPDRQRIVANQEYLWHHDLDLETVTRRPVGALGDMSPLQVLGGDLQQLRQDYSITSAGAGQFVLTPNYANPSFQSLSLGFQSGVIAQMSILDKLDQRIEISFSNLDDGAGLSPADFDFQPPEGVDLFYYDE